MSEELHLPFFPHVRTFCHSCHLVDKYVVVRIIFNLLQINLGKRDIFKILSFLIYENSIYFHLLRSLNFFCWNYFCSFICGGLISLSLELLLGVWFYLFFFFCLIRLIRFSQWYWIEATVEGNFVFLSFQFSFIQYFTFKLTFF